jgi:hypothetical protein
MLVITSGYNSYSESSVSESEVVNGVFTADQDAIIKRDILLFTV